jgi:hypothetical protein
LIDISAIAVPPGYKVIPVAETDAPVIAALDRAWTRLRAEDDRIPRLLFDLQPSRTSGCGSVEFGAPAPVMTLNLAPDWEGDPEKLAEHKLTAPQILETLIHQAAHAVAGPARGQEGRFHSNSYRDAAQQLGLAVEHTGIGWSKTSLASGTESRYRHEIAALDKAMDQWAPVKARKRKRGSVGMHCACTPPRYISASINTAKARSIRCEICGQEFVAS